MPEDLVDVEKVTVVLLSFINGFLNSLMAMEKHSDRFIDIYFIGWNPSVILGISWLTVFSSVWIRISA